MEAERRIWYRKAKLATTSNQERLALSSIQKAIDAGWRDYWLARSEPIMTDLAENNTAQTMLAGLETRLGFVREQFEMDAQFASGWD